jgi:DNA repair protein RadC
LPTTFRIGAASFPPRARGRRSIRREDTPPASRAPRSTTSGHTSHPREVFKAAILANATRVIAVHNHPSGETTPSSADLEITKRLRSAGDLIGIPLLDHVIVTADAFHSLLS